MKMAAQNLFTLKILKIKCVHPFVIYVDFEGRVNTNTHVFTKRN